MSVVAETLAAPAKTAGCGLGFFERYLSVWVALCMGVAILLGKLWPDLIQGLRGLEFGKGSQINVPLRY
jgi:arsenite transporter